jgi:hypothetical protein
MIFREVSRIIIILIAGMMAYLGYRLFVLGHTSGPGRIVARSQLGQIVLSGTGPGLFFMAFGAIILIVALFRGEYSYSATRVASPQGATSAKVPASASMAGDEVAYQVAASAAEQAASGVPIETIEASASAARTADPVAPGAAEAARAAAKAASAKAAQSTR